ncbi:MAG: hypothetical protein PHD95_03250 [Candidatus ainarchaeum sp.]|nr:hypothetical protein [Candidatus ainarchaeum sp.]
MANEPEFECEICASIYDNKEEANNCCAEKKISLVCNKCGKTNRGKKQAINCCVSAKKNFSKRGD